MTLYRVSKSDPVEGHQGYEYTTSRRAANRVRARAIRDGNTDTTIEQITVTPTRPGIAQALNRYGDHPDNG